jgi:hypothetical protein
LVESLDEGASVRVAAIGDIGGHSGVLADAIRRVGGDPATGDLPGDLIVVQVGDLVHRGPDSGGAVRLAERMRTRNPSRWIQLLGNHDLAHIGGPMPSDCDRCELAADTVETLRRWWGEGQCFLAAALRTATDETLVTHAGLSVGCWADLGEPTAAVEAAAALNATVGKDDSPAFRAGRLLDGEPNLSAGPCWAEVSQEIYQPWIARAAVPFQQLHGHAAPWDWATDAFWPDTPADVRARCHHDATLRRTTTILGTLGSGRTATATSIDWRLGRIPPATSWPIWSIAAELTEPTF